MPKVNVIWALMTEAVSLATADTAVTVMTMVRIGMLLPRTASVSCLWAPVGTRASCAMIGFSKWVFVKAALSAPRSLVCWSSVWLVQHMLHRLCSNEQTLFHPFSLIGCQG